MHNSLNAYAYVSYSGILSVKSAYQIAKESTPPTYVDPIRGCIWRSNLHDKYKMCIWRMIEGCLPPKDNLSKFINDYDDVFPLCDSVSEFVVHLFALYSVAKAI